MAALRSFVLILFVMMTGISNDQSYSFTGLVDGALMLLLALGIIAIVQTLFNPLRPEQIVLKTVRQFCVGCTRVINEFPLVEPGKQTRKRRLRKRMFESLIQPAPGKIQAAQKHLNYKLFPDNSPAKVQTLIDALQNISYRLQSLEIAQHRLTRHSGRLPDSYEPLSSQIQKFLRGVFESWEHFESSGELSHRQNELADELEEQFDKLILDSEQILSNEQIQTDLYTTIGSLRSLIEAMENTQAIINQINWRQWAIVRF